MLLVDIFVIDPEQCSPDKELRDEMQKDKLVSTAVICCLLQWRLEYKQTYFCRQKYYGRKTKNDMWMLKDPESVSSAKTFVILGNCHS